MKTFIMRLIAKAAIKTAYSGKEKHSWYLSYQPKMPQQLLKDEK
ncbi:cyclic lactone autoinducer peptide [Fusibacter sp. JL216-2]